MQKATNLTDVSSLHVYLCMTTNVVSACIVNEFKNKTDAHWSEQETMYNYRAEIT